MSLAPSSAAQFNLPLFNSVLASSAARKEDKKEENLEQSERRKWQMISGREGKSEEGTSEEENGADGEEEEGEEEGKEKGARKRKSEREKGAQMGKRSERGQQQKREDETAQSQPPQPQRQPMDIPTIALQLLQQAMISRSESMQQRSRENEKLTIFGPSAPNSSPSVLADGRFIPQRASITAKFKKSGSTHSSSAANGRRSVNKGSISAAATAALMAPSPLGALPAIPGALAVAASPAAQLFREDDWSWHRNPAAAIRSGGTNKQTPVWKFFVYNKAENLSRCIVGTCTYQLKGPHTSTLACHLKKHAAEYAEFQRLKTEYTRERMVNGQNSSGSSAGGGRSASARSSPFAGHSSSVGNLPNGLAVDDDCADQKSRSPSVLSDPFPPQYIKSSNCSSPVLPATMPNGRFANFVVSEDEPIGRSLLPRGIPTLNKPPNGVNGIFGSGLPQHFRPLGGHPPSHHFAPLPIQHFLMAATTMAGQNNGIQQRFTSPPPHFDYSMLAQFGKVTKTMDQMETNRTENGFGQDQPKNHGQNDELFANNPLKRDGTAEGGTKGAICGGGTGANLLDILNVLSKRAEAAAKEKAQTDGAETREGRETEDGQRNAVKRKYTVTRESDEQGPQKQWMEQGQSKEIVEGREEEDEGQTQTQLNHSVEHILKDEEEKEEEEMAKKRAKTEAEETRKTNSKTEVMEAGEEGNCANEEESAEPLSPLDRFALFLGTVFPPPVLRHLLKENPFLGQFCSWLGSDNALAFESVDKLLNVHFSRMKDKIRRKLARIRSSVLMVDILCGRCWRYRQSPEELGHPTDECQCQKGTEAHSLITVTLHYKRTQNGPILLAMRRIEEELLIREKEKQPEKREDGVGEGKTDDGIGEVDRLVEQILSDFFSATPSSARPSFLLFRPSFSLHFPPSIRSIPCLPATRPHCLQKRLLTILSKELKFGQLNDHLAKECSHHKTSDNCSSALPSTSTESSNESVKEIIRLHEIISEKSHWFGPEEIDEALCSIRTEKFGRISELVQQINADLSKTANALKLLHKFELTAADGCLINVFVGPLAIFGNVIEAETEWTERSAMLLYNAKRSKEKANNTHE